MKRMELHKEFINQLSLMKVSTVGGVIEKIDLVDRSPRGGIIGVPKKIEDIIQVFYTVDYLIENKLVELVSTKNNDQPDFVENLLIDIFEKDDNSDISEFDDPESKSFSYIKSMPLFIEKYWGMELLVNPSYFKMIQNNYKTDYEKREIRKDNISVWIPVLVAVLVALLTALFSYFFNNKQDVFLFFIK